MSKNPFKHASAKLKELELQGCMTLLRGIAEDHVRMAVMNLREMAELQSRIDLIRKERSDKRKRSVTQ